MVRLLKRLLGAGASSGRPAPGAVPRPFAPRLEVLDGRTMPAVGGLGGATGGIADGGALGGVVNGGAAGVVTADGRGTVEVYGGAAGGVTADRAGADVGVGAVHMRSRGEGIPTDGPLRRRGGEDMPALTLTIGEEIPSDPDGRQRGSK